jgi:hypothetical protein
VDTPVLWSKITISQNDSLEKAHRKLVRSKSCPLDVTVSFDPRTEYTSSVTEQVIKAMDAIRPALRRTRSFCLSVPNRAQANVALQRCQEDAPFLEVFSIRIHHSLQDDPHCTPTLPLFNGQTPRLHSCSFSSYNFGWDCSLLLRLRVLKLDGYFNGFSPSVETLLTILRQCPDLEELALRNLSDVDSDLCYRIQVDQADNHTVENPLTMHRLTKVSFNCTGLSLARQVMRQILVPNLESIELCYLGNVTPILSLLHIQSLESLSLRHIRIESCIFNDMKFLALLRRLPFLRSLELIDIEDVSPSLLKVCFINKYIDKYLSLSLQGISSSKPAVCPRLETLCLDGCSSFSWDSLRTFIESRLTAVTPALSHERVLQACDLRDRATSIPSRTSQQGSLPPQSSEVAAQTSLPQRIRSIDVTRCGQVNREMIQWLRIFVSEVKCEPAKSAWGEQIP